MVSSEGKRRERVGALAFVGVLAAGLALLVANSGAAPEELLTRGQLDKAAPGCKWWYCAEPTGVFVGSASPQSSCTYRGSHLPCYAHLAFSVSVCSRVRVCACVCMRVCVCV